MNTYLLLAAVVMFACVFLNKISNRLGIPMLLTFILLGMLFGSDGILKIPFNDYAFAEQICSVALIFIMFYGGFGTSWSEAKPTALKAVMLSSAGVVLTAGITGVFCHYVLSMEWLEGLLIGAVISSTDAASVFSVLRSKRLNLKFHTASLLEVESGSNDPFAYMMTAILLAVMQGGITRGEIIYMAFAQIVFGILWGIILAILSVRVLQYFKFSTEGFDTVFVVAIALLSYAASSATGGNGYLSTYIVGIILGNSDIQNKKTLVPFFDGLTGLMQMLVFFLLGLLSFPSRLPAVVLPAGVIALFLTFVARPLVTFLLLTPFRSKWNQQLLVAWSGLRGAASIVFAVMAMMKGDTGNDIFHIVFCIVLFSILIQGSLIPVIAKKLDMIDDSVDVMKTFSDYSDEVPVQFIKFKILPEHSWCGQKVSDIQLPPGTILVLLQRDGKRYVPNGSMVFQAGDTWILSAKSPGEIEGVHLSEKVISPGHKWEGKTVEEIAGNHKKNVLIIMVQRGSKVIIPNGKTVLMQNDVLVLNHEEED